MKTLIAITLAAGFALVGCKNKSSTATAGSAGSAETMAGSAGSAGSAEAGSAGSAEAGSAGSAEAGSGSSAAVDLPTEEDFEAQAQTDVTDKNLATKVKALESELN